MTRHDNPGIFDMAITYHPIGVVYSPFKNIAGMPIQPPGAVGVQGKVEVFPEYQRGLQDVEGFSHIILLYHLHRAKEAKLMVTPFLDPQPRGVFATRAPTRPNPIGLSVVKLLKLDEHILHIENVDILDSTPLLDIKPYVPAFEHYDEIRLGWLENTEQDVKNKRSDDRFR
jgi:tRNA-Thr(GGU) m(6)t(6)A37 methyltransferase TsaA